MSKRKTWNPGPETPPPVRLPSQGRLPGFTDAELDEIAGVLEHYRSIELDAKANIKEVRDRENGRISDAALEVIAVLQTKYKRNSIVIDGLIGEIKAKLKIEVKGARKPARVEEAVR